MRHVGVREFKDKATTLLASDETLVIERHGTALISYAKDAKSAVESGG